MTRAGAALVRTITSVITKAVFTLKPKRNQSEHVSRKYVSPMLFHCLRQMLVSNMFYAWLNNLCCFMLLA